MVKPKSNKPKQKNILDVNPITSQRISLIQSKERLSKFQNINETTISQKSDFIKKRLEQLNAIKSSMSYSEKKRLEYLESLFHNPGKIKIPVDKKIDQKEVVRNHKLNLIAEKNRLKVLDSVYKEYNSFLGKKKILQQNLSLRNDLSLKYVFNRRQLSKLNSNLTSLSSEKLSKAIERIATKPKYSSLKAKDLANLIFKNCARIEELSGISGIKRIKVKFDFIFLKIVSLKKKNISNSEIIKNILLSIKEIAMHNIISNSSKIKAKIKDIRSKIIAIDDFKKENDITQINKHLLDIKIFLYILYNLNVPDNLHYFVLYNL
ncbi:hypothetical protein EOM09_06910 [bacterium]|nr:hypothetical protein [bacterium]